jgi:putative DNA methylase
MKKRNYFPGGIKSEGHTAIYKMHKYFARRPHNVFRELIQHYSQNNSLIVDCFGGGGVTLIEGLTAKRRVISYDVNPIASFIQLAQTLEVRRDRVDRFADKIRIRVRELIGDAYTTRCRNCSRAAHVRWFEHAYTVSCPHCNQETLLDSNSKKIAASGKAIDGTYTCNQCSGEFRASSTRRTGSKILNLRYKCQSCGTQESTLPEQYDNDLFLSFERDEEKLVANHDLYMPQEIIPSYWDRQKEDCLSRKGFDRFVDFFTPRNRVCSAIYFKALEELKEECTPEEFYFMLLNVSALLRYTNNMTFSTGSWMDGRPVAWAKHAFWTPNQFVECNPLEYFDHRIKAAFAGIKDQGQRFRKTKPSFDESDVVNGIATHCVRHASSSDMNLPDASVDLVITDPPYGSNVQYGELCHFWLVWIRRFLPFETRQFDLSDEVVVHRKQDKSTGYSKSFVDYRIGLTAVYSECYRVLKEDGHLVFTFNNKNPEAWFSVIKAALDAGFDLEAEGITYQEQIEAYRDTAHLRFDGTAEGDFIYSFVKRPKVHAKAPSIELTQVTADKINGVIEGMVNLGKPFTEAQLFIHCYKELLGTLVPYIKAGVPEKQVIECLDLNRVLKRLYDHKSLKKQGNSWIVNDILPLSGVLI